MILQSPSRLGLSNNPGSSLLRVLVAVAIVIAASVLAAVGALRPIENGLQDLGFAMRSTEASGQVAVVEMDAASLAAIRQWPWDRTHYARVVDRLDRAGARTIAFDVDFSARSNPADDARFARSLEKASANIVLPVFGQQASAADQRQLDALPIPLLREHVLLGSVSVQPDPTGIVRDMPIGTFNSDAPRPSLSAQLAQRSGVADQPFPIDFAIDPGSLPRHSFIAVERGEFDAGAFAGKDVVIGATAIEMGDRYAVPRHGILPGLIVQALAAETLLDGIPNRVGWPVLLLPAFGLVWLILGARHRRQIVLRTGGAVVVTLTVLHFGAILANQIFAVAPSVLVILASAIVRWAALVHADFEQTRMIDPETGMPNRRAFEKEIVNGSHTRVIAAMIDGFETIRMVVEDSEIGSLFGRIEDRLCAAGCGERIYRVDDRVVAWTTALEPFEIEGQLQGLAAVMRHPLEITGRRIDARLAFGIADGREISDAAHAASQALRSGSCFAYHEHAEKLVLDQQLSLMGELDEGIRRGELEVLYQPKLDLRSDRITSAEALIRWNHPTRGYLRPDIFIPLAEEADRIDDLTLFVLRRAIEDLDTWCSAGHVMKVAVNVSAVLISSPAFAVRLEHILREEGVPRERVTLEITESAAIIDFEAARSALEAIRALGVSISMDDYGTGQSTLTYLKGLPLSELKIDRSFVQYAHRDQGDALLVSSTVELAHQMGLEVVAEGIEDADCLAFLRSIGCDFAQGYHIAKPMSAEDLLELVRISPPLSSRKAA
ncbi:putative bifunctional diguanylate cyclase/phosphodiesterase [Qipengyuania spongiae]|uniref:EAL domain-containing protein n=1 Tax=Qipengyuania spongiae TaxID=2909673 RepID=A0ABY5SXU3_9SPHN|nr:EAL domain-containing protein [Qipengyuania spongiae]UVI39044.1 EAL domain-containing protein [Qipengyuania spongiae]